MKKLTKKERAALRKAAELIAIGEYSYSCMAVERVGGRLLRVKYAKFYDQSPDDYWFFPTSRRGEPIAVSEHLDYVESLFGLRVLLLLTFAEVG